MGDDKAVKIKQDNGEIRMIGTFNEKSKILRVIRRRSQHFMRKLSAWGLDAKVFNGLYEDRGLRKIILRETEEHKKFEISAKTFKEKGKYLHFKPYRPQIFVEEKFWEVR
jgi:hypothetical protein